MLDKRPLRAATFRHLAAGYWVNELGNWFGEIALAILVFNRTRSALATAALFLTLRFLPALLAPLLTARVEVLRPRLVLATMYTLEGAFFAVMALLTRHFSLSVLLVLCALDGTLAITAKALTRGVSATWLLSHDGLRGGNAILNLGAMGSAALGPALAGAAVAWQGAPTALLIDAASFLLTAAVMATAPGLRVEIDRTAGFAGRLRGGLRVIRDHSAVRRLFVAIGLAMMLGSIVIPIEVIFAKATLHAGDRGYGFLLGAWGVGMIVGGAGFAVATEMSLIGLLGAGALLTAAGYTGLALSPTLLVACACSALGGVGNGVSWIAAVTAVQERIPISTQSGVMSVLEGLNQVMPAAGFVVGGALTAASSPRVAYAVSAAGIVLVVLIFALRPLDRIRLRPVEPEAGPRELSVPTNGQSVPGDLFRRQSAQTYRQELSTPARTLPVISQ